MNRFVTVSLTCAIVLATASCATDEYGKKRPLTNMQKGAMIGAGAGALAGYLGRKDHKGKGALYGAVGGGLVGGAVGAYMDSQRKDLEKALAGEEVQQFPSPTLPYAAPKLVTRRGERLLLDNGLCRSRQEVVYFAGKGPSKRAGCLENEVEVPDVRTLTAADAQLRVEAQPLTPKLIYKPAEPLQRVGIVVDQLPKRGYRSSYDEIILVVSKATQGVIPNLVGRDVDDARLRLKRLKLEPKIIWGDGDPGTVLRQKPRPGLAAAPGVTVELVVARPRATAAAAG